LLPAVIAMSCEEESAPVPAAKFATPVTADELLGNWALKSVTESDYTYIEGKGQTISETRYGITGAEYDSIKTNGAIRYEKHGRKAVWNISFTKNTDFKINAQNFPFQNALYAVTVSGNKITVTNMIYKVEKISKSEWHLVNYRMENQATFIETTYRIMR